MTISAESGSGEPRLAAGGPTAVVAPSFAELGSRRFDMLVVGGGVTGAAIALAAARRHLDVALVEQEDFGASTSANSLKILHGGLRDLKRGDLPAVRAGAREQAAWARLAPHLVDPLPFLLPTYRSLGQGRTALRAALTLARGIALAARIERPFPEGRLLSVEEARALVPDLPGRPNGAALWYEGQMYSAERLVLAMVSAAAASGATAANHARVRDLLRTADGAVYGARIQDTLTGDVAELRAARTVIAAGADAPALVARLLGRPPDPRRYSLAMNVVLRGPPPSVAFALQSRAPDGARRQLLFTPWRGRTLLGTGHYEHAGPPSGFRPETVDPRPLLAEANAAWSGPRFTSDDVLLVHAGLLPLRATPEPSAGDLMRHPVVQEHAAEGAPGLVSVVSVRFSYARLLADRVLSTLQGCPMSSRSPATLPGGEGLVMGRVDGSIVSSEAPLPADVRDHLARCYGSRVQAFLAGVRDVPGWMERAVPGEPVIFGQLVHGVREEWARTSEDLVWRRTELGPRGLASAHVEALAARALALVSGAGPQDGAAEGVR